MLADCEGLPAGPVANVNGKIGGDMDEAGIEAAPELASRWARLGAAIIDGFLIMLVTMPLAYFLGMFDNLGMAPPRIGVVITISVVGYLWFFAINGKLLFDRAQSIGKWLFDIKIVKLDGAKPSFTDLIVKRYAPFWAFPNVPYIGGLLNLVNVCFIFRSDKRCIHDLIAGTKVINDQPPS